MIRALDSKTDPDFFAPGSPAAGSRRLRV